MIDAAFSDTTPASTGTAARRKVVMLPNIYMYTDASAMGTHGFSSLAVPDTKITNARETHWYSEEERVRNTEVIPAADIPQHPKGRKARILLSSVFGPYA